MIYNFSSRPLGFSHYLKCRRHIVLLMASPDSAGNSTLQKCGLSQQEGRGGVKGEGPCGCGLSEDERGGSL